MISEGFVKINRNILEWGWYKNQNTARVFIHLLLCANYIDCEFEGKTIKRGQLVTGRKKLSVDLNMTEREVRTALTHLKTTNEITIETTSKYSIITIKNYDKYQSVPNESTSERPTSDQQTTNDRPQYKKEKNNKKYKKARNIHAHTREAHSCSYNIEDFDKNPPFDD